MKSMGVGKDTAIFSLANSEIAQFVDSLDWTQYANFQIC